MNIFFLSQDLVECASWHCDQHTNKMRTESCQLLCTTLRVHDSGRGILIPPKEGEFEFLPKAFNPNHPSRRWLDESMGNIELLMELLIALIHEHFSRFGLSLEDQKSYHVYRWLENNIANLQDYIPSKGITDISLAMPIHLQKEHGYEYKDGKYSTYKTSPEKAVIAYQAFYNEKTFKGDVPLKWTKPALMPSWFTGNGIQIDND